MTDPLDIIFDNLGIWFLRVKDRIHRLQDWVQLSIYSTRALVH